MAYTLPQLIRFVDGNRRANATFVKLTKYKAGYTPDGHGFAACQSYSTAHYDENGLIIRNHARNKYVTVITFIDKTLHVKVSCSCSDFLFRHEYALNKHGAADIEYSNGEAPLFTNPSNHPNTCKHLYALWLHIKGSIVKKKR